jgi:hypothetical protein
VGLPVFPPFVARQRLGKHVPTTTKIIRGVFFYVTRAVSKESRRLSFTCSQDCSLKIKMKY